MVLLWLPGITLAAMLGPSPASAGDAAKIFTGAAPAVVKLYGAGAGREHGYGSGVLISPDGRILTTLSILVSGRNIRVVLADGRRYDAEVLRTDEPRQLALLKIDAENLPHLSPASTRHLQVGDAMYALGNWFKIAEGDETVSLNRGILSLRTNLDARRLSQDFEYTGEVLVYDAITANPGAAGGPVVDGEGRLVGLVGKIVEASATNTRLNYAIPGEELLAFLGEKPRPRPEPVRTAATTAPSAPYVGIKVSSLGYRHVAAFVERVRPGSPADQAGIKPDDLIMAIDGRRIADADAYREALGQALPGQTMQFTIKRGPRVLTIAVTIGEPPA